MRGQNSHHLRQRPAVAALLRALAPRAGFHLGALLRRIDLCLAQSEDDAARLLQLGAPRVHAVGNLKYDVEAPPADAARLQALAGRHRDARGSGSPPPPMRAKRRWRCWRHKQLAPAISRSAHRAGAAPCRTAATRSPLWRESAGLAAAQRSRNEPLDATNADLYRRHHGRTGAVLSAVQRDLRRQVAGGAAAGRTRSSRRNSARPFSTARMSAISLTSTPRWTRRAARSRWPTPANWPGGLGCCSAIPTLLRKTAEASRASVAAMSGASDRVMRALEPYVAAMMVSGQ